MSTQSGPASVEQQQNFPAAADYKRKRPQGGSTGCQPIRVHKQDGPSRFIQFRGNLCWRMAHASLMKINCSSRARGGGALHCNVTTKPATHFARAHSCCVARLQARPGRPGCPGVKLMLSSGWAASGRHRRPHCIPSRPPRNLGLGCRLTEV